MNIFFRNKDYRRFSMASFLSSAGDILFYLALMTYASKLNNYSLALSLIAISESLPRLFTIFGGYLADRTQNKFKNIFIMSIIRCILYGLVGILFISNISQWNLVIIVIVINFFSDTIGSYSTGLTTPLIVNLVGEEDFAEAEGFTNGISQIISTIAQFIGSGLLLFLSYSNLAFANSITFLIAGILYLSVGIRHKAESTANEEVKINDQKFLTTIKSSYIQMKKSPGLLSVITVIALLNGVLSAMASLLPIVIAGNKSKMIISNYSFTLATIGMAVSCGAILGSTVGIKLLKRQSVFFITIIAITLSIGTTITALLANIFIILPIYSLLAFITSIASLKMQQWLVSNIEHKILASSVGLVDTLLLLAAPLTTTVLTTLSGISSVKIALFTLLIVEIIILFIAIRLIFKINVLINKENRAVIIEK